jgi:serine/threonine protein kinase
LDVTASSAQNYFSEHSPTKMMDDETKRVPPNSGVDSQGSRLTMGSSHRMNDHLSISPSLTPTNLSFNEQLDSDGNTMRVGDLVFIPGVLGQGAFGTVRLARRVITFRSKLGNIHRDDGESGVDKSTYGCDTVGLGERNINPLQTLTTPGLGTGSSHRYSGDIWRGMRKDGVQTDDLTSDSGHRFSRSSSPVSNIRDDHLSSDQTLENSEHEPASRSSLTPALFTNLQVSDSTSIENDSTFCSLSSPDRIDLNKKKTNSGRTETSNSGTLGGLTRRILSRTTELGRSNFVRASPSLEEVSKRSSQNLTEAETFDENDQECSTETQQLQVVAVKIFSKSFLKRQRTMVRDSRTRRMQVKTALMQVEREIAIMKKLSHPNVVVLYDVIDSPESDLLYMVIEYMPLGEILTYQYNGTFRRQKPKIILNQPEQIYVNSKQRTSIPFQQNHGFGVIEDYDIQGVVDGHFDEAHSALYFVDIMHGLAYLHSHHIIHRDLKPGKRRNTRFWFALSSC